MDMQQDLISLLTNHVGSLSVCLVASHVSFMVKCLPKSFAHLKKIDSSVSFLLNCRNSSYILDPSPLTNMFAKFFPQSMACLHYFNSVFQD